MFDRGRFGGEFERSELASRPGERDEQQYRKCCGGRDEIRRVLLPDGNHSYILFVSLRFSNARLRSAAGGFMKLLILVAAFLSVPAFAGEFSACDHAPGTVLLDGTVEESGDCAAGVISNSVCI